MSINPKVIFSLHYNLWQTFLSERISFIKPKDNLPATSHDLFYWWEEEFHFLSWRPCSRPLRCTRSRRWRWQKVDPPSLCCCCCYSTRGTSCKHHRIKLTVSVEKNKQIKIRFVLLTRQATKLQNSSCTQVKFENYFHFGKINFGQDARFFVADVFLDL